MAGYATNGSPDKKVAEDIRRSAAGRALSGKGLPFMLRPSGENGLGFRCDGSPMFRGYLEDCGSSVS